MRHLPDAGIVSLVEAKRTCIDPRLAQTQSEFYVQQIARREGDHLLQTLLHRAFRGES